ncbi:tubulin polyglutamylase TTLL13-like isoform X2 [Tympanuchus pallidicinctus]|uniref:tubulin polyglutamylase TTLL13-like isoform X2 n=1 Tax=Tympanuchus pallidicinctus TaxID=109042 RepID=UPI0022872A78|nr:tubulin polyglutamylase TTLL13-like isoform X2 [Tympanuchus pallidicinctus]
MGTAAVSSGAMEASGGGGGSSGTAAASGSAAPGNESGAAASSSRPRKKRRKCSIPSINLSSCKYESVRRAALCCGLREAGENEEWTVYWTDCSVSLERVMEMKRFQKINHFPGMIEICRKDLLARNLNRMLKLFPKEYNIFPRTWSLPADYGDFQAYRRRRKNRTFICKPDSGCQGRGIFITRDPGEIRHGEHMICQQYISKPFLIDGFKFDMRVYVLVTSCDPLRIFVYKEGLARFATMRGLWCITSLKNVESVGLWPSRQSDARCPSPIAAQLPALCHSNTFMSWRGLLLHGDICMHLTNYAINKRNANFVQDDTMGSKRKLSTLNAWMMDNSYNTTKLWEDIEDIIIKTLISAHPVVKHNYQSCFPNHTTSCACFEILGFDILLDRNLKPWLLEVNHSPSFTTDSHLDREVKDALLFDTINLINVHACSKRKAMEEDKQQAKERLLQARRSPRVSRHEEAEGSQAAWLSEAEDYENSHLGSYRRIYPACGTDKYEPFFKQSSSLFKETASSRAREECTRQQLEEIRMKKEKLEAVNSKKKKERKEGLQGESPADKSMIHNKASASATHFTYRSTKMWDKKTEHVQYDSMQPQDILENEEKKRVNALARRKNLIQGLGIVDQLSQLLPTTGRSSDSHRPCAVTSEMQTQFLWDAPQAQQPAPLMTIIPLSFPRGTVWPSGRPCARKHSTRAQLLAGQHPAPGTLLVRGQSIPFREQHTVQCSAQPQDRGNSWSRAAEPAAATQPCTKTRRPMSAWQLSAARNEAEGCDVGRPLCAGSAHRGSLGCPARAGKATGDGGFSGAAARRLLVASAALVLHTRCASAMNFRDVSSTGKGQRRLQPPPGRRSLHRGCRGFHPSALALVMGSCGTSRPSCPSGLRTAGYRRPRSPQPQVPGSGTPCPDPAVPPALPPPSGRPRPAPPRVMAALVRRGLRVGALLAASPRRAAATWHGEPEPPNAVLDEAERARRRRAAARLRRVLGAERGAPERTLTWEAMEQMRFLRQELPEEWPLERLAEGFGVSPDVVRRVLRSRSRLPPHRRLRQDARALRAAPQRPDPGPAPPAGTEVRAPDGSLLYRLPRGLDGSQ